MCKHIFLILSFLLLLAQPMKSAGNSFTLVVDAGHGGNDFGAPGAVSHEKDLTLRYALAFGRMVESKCPDVKVVYTRKTDIFVPLHERADIANRNHADLFISIHINAVEGSKAAHGFQSYSLGRGERSGDRGIRENLDVAKRENSVILMEKDYKKTYKGMDLNSAEGDIMFELIADNNRQRSVELSRLMQREVCRATGRVDAGSHQNNLAVLRLTSMPAVLLELGFISTPDEEQFMNSDAALDLYTKGIYNAFIIYKNKYDSRSTLPYQNTTVDVSPPTEGVALSAVSNDDDDLSQTKTQGKTVRRAPSRAAAQTRLTDNDSPQERNALRGKSKATKTVRQTGNSKKTLKQSKESDLESRKPVFKVQILAGSYKLKAGDAQFKGLQGWECLRDGNRWLYTYGSSTDYNAVYRTRKQLLDKFPQAFIVAYKDGKAVDVNEAIKEFLAAHGRRQK